MSKISYVADQPVYPETDASATDYLILLKPRVMSLVIFTAFIGAFLAPGHLHPYIFFIAIFCIAIGAGASGAFNMWYDRDIDAIMKRTKNRPIPMGRVHPEEALLLATLLSAGSVVMLGLATNWFAAGLLAFTIFFYVVIYTIYLKRYTPQNIVIGGAAGAFPPMIGWAAVTGDVSIESIILFAIIFFWTPPHFWALSLSCSKDYADARVPMMPIVSGVDETKFQILIYSVILVAVSCLPGLVHMTGTLYMAAALSMGAVFLYLAWKLKRDVSNHYARKLFWFSILYLFLLFLFMLLDRMVNSNG